MQILVELACFHFHCLLLTKAITTPVHIQGGGGGDIDSPGLVGGRVILQRACIYVIVAIFANCYSREVNVSRFYGERQKNLRRNDKRLIPKPNHYLNRSG